VSGQNSIFVRVPDWNPPESSTGSSNRSLKPKLDHREYGGTGLGLPSAKVWSN